MDPTDPSPSPSCDTIPPSSRAATWSLALSLVGLVFPPSFAMVPAIVLGHLGLSSIRKSKGRLRGRFRAIAGLCIGYMVLILQVLFFTLILWGGSLPAWIEGVRNPPSTAVVLALTDPSASREDVKTVLRDRLRAANIPHRISLVDPDRLEVRFTPRGDMDAERVAELLLRPAFLEFRLVNQNNDPLIDDLFQRGIAPPGFSIIRVEGTRYYKRDPLYDPPENWSDLIATTGQISPLYELMLETTWVENHGGSLFRPHFVSVMLLLDGSSVQRARPEPDMYGRLQVALSFNQDGARRFADLTRDYGPRGPKNPADSGRRLAIVMDDTLYSAPTINQPILGGKAVITGGFSMEEARTLANALNAGSLPTDLELVELRDLR